MDIADREILLRDIKVYLALAAGVANAAILPFDWRAQVSEFAETVDKYQKEAGDAFDLSPSRDAALALDKSSRRFLRRRRRPGRPTPMRRTTRFSNWRGFWCPINYTRVPRFRHDPGDADAAAADHRIGDRVEGDRQGEARLRKDATHARPEPPRRSAPRGRGGRKARHVANHRGGACRRPFRSSCLIEKTLGDKQLVRDLVHPALQSDDGEAVRIGIFLQ